MPNGLLKYLKSLLQSMQRHPVSKGRIPIAVNRLDCAADELYVLLSY